MSCCIEISLAIIAHSAIWEENQKGLPKHNVISAKINFESKRQMNRGCLKKGKKAKGLKIFCIETLIFMTKFPQANKNLHSYKMEK